jgi:hypothetical protein
MPNSLRLISKRVVPALVTGTFFVAAMFLLAVVWNPASAETADQQGVETSLLVSLDKPMAPAPRAVEIADDADQAEVTVPDLVNELNTWTFTNKPNNNGGHGNHGPHGHPHPGHHHHPPPHPKHHHHSPHR